MSKKNDFAISVLTKRVEFIATEIISTESELLNYTRRVEKSENRITQLGTDRDNLLAVIEGLTEPVEEQPNE